MSSSILYRPTAHRLKGPTMDFPRLHVKDCVSFVNFALLQDSKIDGIFLKDHLIPYSGMEPCDEFLWGANGHNSIYGLEFAAHAYANANGMIPIAVRSWYKISNCKSIQISEDDARASGFLHLQRIQQKFRNSILETIFDDAIHLASDFKISNVGRKTMLSTKEMCDFFSRYPVLVKLLFKHFPYLNVIVHPVLHLYHDGHKDSFNVATVRNQRDKIESVAMYGNYEMVVL